MIDIENFIFNSIASSVRTSFPNIFLTGEYVDTPSSFPAASIVESDNSILQKMRTKNIENAVTLMYQVDVYSNKIGYKKQEAQDIINEIDSEFASLGFTRVMCSPTSNIMDASIYRITARYQAVAMREEDENGLDVTYRIYQN